MTSILKEQTFWSKLVSGRKGNSEWIGIIGFLLAIIYAIVQSSELFSVGSSQHAHAASGYWIACSLLLGVACILFMVIVIETSVYRRLASKVESWSPINMVCLSPALFALVGFSVLHWTLSAYSYLYTDPGLWRVYKDGEVVEGGHAAEGYDPWIAASLVINPTRTLWFDKKIQSSFDSRNVEIKVFFSVELEPNPGFRRFLSSNVSQLGIGNTPEQQRILLKDLIGDQVGEYQEAIRTLYEEAESGQLQTDEVTWLIRFDQLARTSLETVLPFAKDVRITKVELVSIGSE